MPKRHEQKVLGSLEKIGFLELSRANLFIKVCSKLTQTTTSRGKAMQDLAQAALDQASPATTSAISLRRRAMLGLCLATCTPTCVTGGK